jgi:hypothetical protein
MTLVWTDPVFGGSILMNLKLGGCAQLNIDVSQAGKKENKVIPSPPGFGSYQTRAPD